MDVIDTPSTRYRVRPFSGANYRENSKKALKEGQEHCGICGRPTWWTKAGGVGIVIGGGGEWGDENSPDDGGHMGCFPIGPDCHRRYRVTEGEP